MKVRLENLTKVFPSRGKDGVETRAVDNFTYDIPDGKLIGLLGPSGCGKSTTLFMLSGLLKPSSGKIFFGDDDVTNLTPEKRGVGLVFQNYALYPHMTVRQNIMFPLQNLKVPKAEIMERTVEAARLVQNIVDKGEYHWGIYTGRYDYWGGTAKDVKSDDALLCQANWAETDLDAVVTTQVYLVTNEGEKLLSVNDSVEGGTIKVVQETKYYHDGVETENVMFLRTMHYTLKTA